MLQCLCCQLNMAPWPSGKAKVCNTSITSSNLVGAWWKELRRNSRFFFYKDLGASVMPNWRFTLMIARWQQFPSNLTIAPFSIWTCRPQKLEQPVQSILNSWVSIFDCKVVSSLYSWTYYITMESLCATIRISYVLEFTGFI